MVNSRAKGAINKSKRLKNIPIDPSDFTIGGSVIATICETYWYECSYEQLSNLVVMAEALEYLTKFIKRTSNYKRQLKDKNGKLKGKRGSRRAGTSKQAKGTRANS